jgi:hypothetical protein
MPEEPPERTSIVEKRPENQTMLIKLGQKVQGVTLLLLLAGVSSAEGASAELALLTPVLPLPVSAACMEWHRLPFR